MQTDEREDYSLGLTAERETVPFRKLENYDCTDG